MVRITKAQALCIASIVYIATLVPVYYAINAYIDDKVTRLRDEALSALNSFFVEKPMYVDLLYGPYPCSYKQVEIPQPEEPSFTEIANIQYVMKNNENKNMSYEEVENTIKMNLKKQWEETYGDITRMYDLDVYPAESERDSKRGWVLKILKKKPDWANNTFVMGGGVETYFLFPKQVAYKKIAPLLQGSVPSVETAVNDALDFVIRNERSDLQPYYSRGCTYNLEDRMKLAINNEFYYFAQDTLVGTIRYGDGSPTIGDGGMYNGYYEVFFHRTQPKTYSIRYVGDDVVTKDKHKMLAICAGILALIYIALITTIRYRLNKSSHTLDIKNQ